ncbi:PfkB family carbohydrate kinase [Prevotella sp. E13-17]|uniref:PfkB family carbohydrate kinase n=1 Tax=Prevotella sp. E13-17 TaxID=2913616 RepID=UPI001EDC4DE8|nr:PfkB family carbohydrate kinase [Prevotella sp. E13-17]UKK50884.1 PfkB family carbohydrate kinase [Prevotella sp. E13-17]
MQKVIGIGETVLDIIFKNDQPIGAVPGGSTFNCLISLGRSGVKASLVSETGNDRVGRKIIDFIEKNGVDASCVYVYPDSKSPVSLAFLNEKNDADYIFYKDHVNDRIEFSYPDIQKDDIVLFGSYFAVNPVIRPQVQAFLEYARNRGAILYYDVNFRSSHKNEVLKLTPNILENLEMADIVRGSSEDFEVMFHKTDPDVLYRSQIAFYTKKFIYTSGDGPVELRADENFAKQYVVDPNNKVVSTIGAGDNFNAGFVFGMIKNRITRENIECGLSEQQWDSIIDYAMQFSANVCQSVGNSVDESFGSAMAALLAE